MKKKEKNIDAKIDDLAKMLARGFAKTQKEIDDLAQMTAQGFTDMHKEAQDGMTDLRQEFKADMTHLQGNIDIMLDRHIGTFRKDYDDLAARVKKLEQQMLAR